MYIKKISGYIIGLQEHGSGQQEKTTEQSLYRVVKQGRILSRSEEANPQRCKSVDFASIANQGLLYYQVVTNQGTCETCAAHSGAIYPVIQAQEGVNLPPFHPNCKCTVHGFSTTNPNADPWMGETALWLDLMYGDGSLEDKAQRLLEHYGWTEFSVQTITDVLSQIEDIDVIGTRMSEFFRLLDMAAEQPESPEGEEAFQLPTVHFEGKTSPLSPIDTTLPSEWTDYVDAISSMLDVDYYLVLAIILHESGGDPDAHNTNWFDDPMQQASGLMQIIPRWHSAYQEEGQYSDNYTDVIEYAEEHGGDINDLFDPLGNIAVGIMMLNEQRKLCEDPDDMREWVGRYGEGTRTSTTEILYYRDLLAAQDGLDTWYSDEYYDSLMTD